MGASSELTVEFIDQSIVLAEDSRLHFGRGLDDKIKSLVIDEDNPHLHRKLGEFAFDGTQWWLRNIGRSIPIRLWTADGTRSVVMSGSEVSLTSTSTTLEFEAGRSKYELSAHLSTERDSQIEEDASDSEDGEDVELTISADDLQFTESQKQLIVSLAESALRNPGQAISVPPSKEAAARLGWKMTKFNAKLQNVCERLEKKLGVRGLSSGASGAKMDRRLRLVEYCVFNGVVTADDLYVLDKTIEDET